MAVFCSAGVPRKSRPGPMHAHTLPIARPDFSAAARTFGGSICEGSSIAISTVSNPQRRKVGKSETLCVVKGEVKRKVLMPILMGREGVISSQDFFRERK